MKPISYACALPALLLLTFTSAKSQHLDAETLSIGPYNIYSDVFTLDPRCVAIGSFNEFLDHYNLAIGSNNKFFGAANISVGSYNWFGYEELHNVDNLTDNSAAIGSNNMVNSNSTLVVGTLNESDPDHMGWGSRDSIVAGRLNCNSGVYTLIMGLNNNIPYYETGDEGNPLGFPAATMLLGKGLISRTDECVVVGKNNLAAAERQTGGQAPVFVVGVGQTASTRADALVVRANGDIVITKPQGDISMGIYE